MIKTIIKNNIRIITSIITLIITLIISDLNRGLISDYYEFKRNDLVD